MQITKSQFKIIIISLILLPIVIIGGLVVGTNMNQKTVEEIAPSTYIKMDAFAAGYSPNEFVVPVGKVVTWEIENKGAAGCTGNIIAKDLLDKVLDIGTRGDKKVVTFKVDETGVYAFSCSMGMFGGKIRDV